MAFKPKTADVRLGKALPGKPFSGAGSSKGNPFAAKPGGSGNKLGSPKSYAKGK